MSCKTSLLGIGSNCSASKGGITDVLLVGISSDVKFKMVTATLDTKTNYESWSIDQTISEFQQFFKYETSRETSSFTSTLNVDLTNGTRYVSTEIILQFNRMEHEKMKEMNEITKGDFMIFVKDSNNEWYVFGFNDYDVASATSATAQTGGEKSDGNYYQVTLSSAESSFPIPTTDNATIKYLNDKLSA